VSQEDSVLTHVTEETMAETTNDTLKASKGLGGLQRDFVGGGHWSLLNS